MEQPHLSQVAERVHIYRHLPSQVAEQSKIYKDTVEFSGTPRPPTLNMSIFDYLMFISLLYSYLGDEVAIKLYDVFVNLSSLSHLAEKVQLLRSKRKDPKFLES